MDHFEMVEKLRAKANVSYEDAKNALEASNWDLLDALVLLEGEGKTYTTKEKPAEPVETKEKKRASNPGWFPRLLTAVSKIVSKGNAISFQVHKNGKLIFSLPLTALVLLLVFLFWCVFILSVVGLFFNFRYSFHGEHVNEGVNRVMDKASGIADNIKNNIHEDKE
jgi:hypothetical protein